MDCIKSYIEKNYSEKRKLHTYGVYDTVRELAGLYGADAEKAGIAALFHDMYREKGDLEHSKAAASAMEKDFGIEDEDILNAVRFHTTGRAGMSTLEKVVFLADAIEPSRDYQGVEEIREAARVDLDRACLLVLESTIEYVRGRGIALDGDTVEARDWLGGT